MVLSERPDWSFLFADGPSTWESFKAEHEARRAEQREQLAGEYPTLAELGFHVHAAADDDEDEDDDDATP